MTNATHRPTGADGQPRVTGSALVPARAIAPARIAAKAAPRLPDTLDRDFLPAALEILLTPPSPAASAMLLTICGAVLAALSWASLCWIDVHAVAIGKVQPSGRSKLVQPLEPGKVVAIRVENGSTVMAGDVLLELDPTETGADREALTRDLEAVVAEVARRRVAVAVAITDSTSLSTPMMSFDGAVGEQVPRREQAVLAADLGQLRATIGSLKAMVAEKQATRQRLADSVEARQQLLALTRERVEMRTDVETRGAGSRALIIDAMQQYHTHVMAEVGERGQMQEAAAAAASLRQRIEETISQFIAEQTQKLAEIERKRDRLEQELVKAQSRNDRTQLRAPIGGTVQQLSVTSVGQVVTSGQSLLTIVPLEGPIEVEALITNRDIGFIEAGQPAVIKVDAFPFTRYGTIDATVAKVSRDAVDDRASTGLSDVASAARQQGAGPGSISRSSNLVFPAVLTLAQRSIRVDGRDIALMAGMAVTVEVKTGQRRLIDYVLSPLRETAARAGHER